MTGKEMREVTREETREVTEEERGESAGESLSYCVSDPYSINASSINLVGCGCSFSVRLSVK